jgi:hypothetical protein
MSRNTKLRLYYTNIDLTSVKFGKRKQKESEQMRTLRAYKYAKEQQEIRPTKLV